MTDPSLVISIDRSDMEGAPEPLVFSGTLGSDRLGVVNYQPPSLVQRISTVPDSVDRIGSVVNGFAYEDSLLGFDWCREDSTEAEVQAAYAEVAAALNRISYPVTTEISGAPAEVWTAKPGSIARSTRTYTDLVRPGTQVFAVTMAVHPIAGS